MILSIITCVGSVAPRERGDVTGVISTDPCISLYTLALPGLQAGKVKDLQAGTRARQPRKLSFSTTKRSKLVCQANL